MVRTATWPRRLNHPVIQLAMGALDAGTIIALQKYGPPDVGCALQISAIARPTSMVIIALINKESLLDRPRHRERKQDYTMTQPQTITAGPPVVRP
jgi:hypothetical protein